MQNLEPQGVRAKIFRTKELGPNLSPIMFSMSYVDVIVIIFEGEKDVNDRRHS